MRQAPARIGHPVYADMPTTIFEKMSGLARDLGAINLGQGFPDAQGPAEMLDAAARALHEQSNQYPPMAGIPELRDAVACFYAMHQGLSLARDQVIVTSGATEALAAAIFALVGTGDEVLIFPPCYDAYAPLIARAGGVARPVPLAPPHWRYDRAAIEAAIGPRTRAIILNDPLNPTGTLAGEAELAMLAGICVAHDLIAICDEVWELMRFDSAPHRSLIDFPGMAARTVKIGSAGKLLALTGWKVGWMCASLPLAAVLARAHQFLTFTTPPNLQWAVAQGLRMPGEWFAAAQAGFARSRQRLARGLGEAGYVVLPNAATWFLCVDLPASGIMLDDATFAGRAAHEAGVVVIPISAFIDKAPVRHFVRLCYTKADATLDEAVARLAGFRAQLVAE